MKKSKYLSKKSFIETFKKSPRVAVVLLIRNRKEELLLVRRGLPPCENMWSMPGAFLLRNESIADCIKRIAVEKLGIEISQNDCRILDASEYMADPRGHVVQIVYKYRLLRDILLKPWGESSELAYFGTPPDDLAFNHQEILAKWYNNKVLRG